MDESVGAGVLELELPHAAISKVGINSREAANQRFLNVITHAPEGDEGFGARRFDDGFGAGGSDRGTAS